MGTIVSISTNRRGFIMLKKLALPTLLILGVSASAAQSFYDDEWNSKGLIGLEIGAIGTDYQENSPTNIADRVNKDTTDTLSPSFGLKLGSESKDYRLFIEGKIWKTNEYDYGSTIGPSIQYLHRYGDAFNIFIGLNGGVVNVKDSKWDLYAGADAGVNIGLADNFDLEVGVRYSAVDINSDASEKISSFYHGYMSAIFKIPNQ